MANKAGQQLLDTIEFSKQFKNLNEYDVWAQTHQAMIDILRDGWRGRATRELIIGREVAAIRNRLKVALDIKDEQNDEIKTTPVSRRKQ